MNSNLPHILMLYTALIPSVRLCGHCQLTLLAEQGKAEYRHMSLVKASRKDLQWADTVILGRLDDPMSLRLARLAKSAGRQLLYILDDDLLNVPTECRSHDHYAQEDVRQCIQEMIAISDGMITPSPILAEKYITQKQCWLPIEEPSLDPIPYRKHDGQTVRIGFAASPDRTKDLEQILGSMLSTLREKYGSAVEFEFFGAIPEFAKALDARSIAYRDSYDDYRKTLEERAWDIGLAPMPDSPFHACKHYNKFSEYAAVGNVGVFSQVPPYSRVPELYSGAVLCPNDPDSWLQALCRLIEEPDYREALRRQVLEQAHGPLSLTAVTEAFYQSAEAVLQYRASGTVKGTSYWRYRITGLLHWIKSVWNRNGFRLFGKIASKFLTFLGRKRI